MLLDGAAVLDAVRVTFEEMAFLDVAAGPSAEDPIPQEGPVLCLTYVAPRTGTFSLRLPKELKFAVAEAIYGEDWQALTAGQLDDSLLELMNVLAGRLLSQRFGGQSTYSMGLPMIQFDLPPDRPHWNREQFPFHVDEIGFMLFWTEEAE